jgi:23S rRNA (cytidine1920-2'-O)/16S rRNA (cytidine1409-2'-O)-methyltransferase
VTAVVTRARLDAELVRRGLARSRQQAAELIEQGRVAVHGVPAGKPATVVDRDTPVVVQESDEREWASRGAHKLIGALDHFGDVAVDGARCLDAGASTGGFTDVLLDRGAAAVVADDDGYGQLVWRLRTDGRVQVHDRTNVRTLEADAVGGPVDLVVADLSFISLRTVAPALLGLVRPGGDLVLLVKPQFEAGRAEASRGRGVIRDDAVRQRVRDEVADVLTTGGATIMGWVESPLRGADGNVEFFVHAMAPTADEGGIPS